MDVPICSVSCRCSTSDRSLKRAHSPNASARKNGGRGRRTGAWSSEYRAKSRSPPGWQGFGRAHRCEATRGEGGRRRRSVNSPRRADENPCGRSGITSVVPFLEKGGAEAWGRMRNRRSRDRSKSRASLVERRRPRPGKPLRCFTAPSGGSGLGGPLRIGRAHRERRALVSVRVATGASEARLVQCRGPQKHWGWKKTPPRHRPNPPKRSEGRETLRSPVSTGGILLSTRPASPLG